MEHEMNRILRNASRVLGNTFLFDNPWDMEATQVPYTLSEPIDWESQPDNDPEWTFMLARHGFILDLAKAFSITGDDRYRVKAISLMESFITSVPYVGNQKGNCWRSLDSAIRVDNWLSALSLFGSVDDFAPDFRLILEASVRQHADFLASIDTVFSRLSNWGLISNGGLYHASLWLGDAVLENLAIDRIVECVGFQVLEDGVHWEQSPMYHAECLRSLLQDVRLSRSYGHAIPDIIPETAKRMCHATLAAMKPNGNQFMQSDSDDTSVRSLLSEGALLFNDPMLKFGGVAMLEPPFSGEEIRAYDALKIQEPPYISAMLQDSGNYYIRSSWTSNATLTHFRCGALGSGHGHADLLHVDLVGHGRDILVDSGRYTYVDSPERTCLKSSQAHNCIMLDGQDAFVQTDSWGYARKATPLQLPCVSRGAWHLCGGGSLGYMDGACPMLVQRWVLQIGDGCVCIFDSFQGRGPHDCQRFFHFPPEAEIGLVDDSQRTSLGCLSVRNGEVQASLWFDSQDRACLVPSQYSRQYNLIEENVALELSGQVRDTDSRVMIVQIASDGKHDVVEPGLVREIPVVSAKTGETFPSSTARAFVSSMAGAEDITLLFCLDQCIQGVDLLRAGDILGYGKIIVRQGARQEVFAV